MGLSTKAVADAFHVKPETIHRRVCLTGTYFGVSPERLPNGRLDFPNDTIERAKKATARPRKHRGTTSA